MRNVLTGSEIDDKRIFIENNATSTKENLNFPDELYNLSNIRRVLDKENPRGVKCNST
jgi:hypothetical protein